MSTNYYYLLFTTIRKSDLMRKKRRILEENLKKNDDWKKNKLFAWSDYQNYFDDQNWLLICIRNSDDKLDSIIANLVHQSMLPFHQVILVMLTQHGLEDSMAYQLKVFSAVQM